MFIRKPELLIETYGTMYAIRLQIASQDAQTLPGSSSLSKPRCWHDLLRGFNMVEGFPIRPRGHTQKGLELPLDMMAFLAETPRATVFENRLVLKGWATCLAAIEAVDDSLSWHYIREAKDQHLSYDAVTNGCSASDQKVLKLGWSSLDKCRHFLGWCAVSQVLAGEFSCLISLDGSFYACMVG